MQSEMSESERKRLDAEWATVNALREAWGIALRGRMPTYLETISSAKQLAPGWFQPDQSLLVHEYESKDARKFRQIAKAKSQIAKQEITPVEVINQEIETYENLLKDKENRSLDELRKTIDKLYQVRREFQLEKYSEDQVIRRDVYTAHVDLPVSGRGRDYLEFSLPDDRALRIRMLHPNKPEHITGADVIYEHYCNDSKTGEKYSSIYFAAIQYKIWDGKTLYIDDRMINQINKLQDKFCKSGFCEETDKDSLIVFRLPYCAAFIRPTDQLQSADSKLISSGFHIRVCAIDELWENTNEGGKKITLSTLKSHRNESVSHEVFENLFKNNMLGSRRVTHDELNDLYQKYGILHPGERVIIHAQDFER